MLEIMRATCCVGRSARPEPGLENKPKAPWHRQPEYGGAPYGPQSSSIFRQPEYGGAPYGPQSSSIFRKANFAHRVVTSHPTNLEAAAYLMVLSFSFPDSAGAPCGLRVNHCSNPVLRLLFGSHRTPWWASSDQEPYIAFHCTSPHCARGRSQRPHGTLDPPCPNPLLLPLCAHPSLAPLNGSSARRPIQSSSSASISASTSCSDAASARICVSFCRSARPVFFRFSN